MAAVGDSVTAVGKILPNAIGEKLILRERRPIGVLYRELFVESHHLL
jgi:hypothetical protein